MNIISSMNARHCDSDCRGANNCKGFAECSACGKVVCGCEIDEKGHCDDCSEEVEDDEEND